jgi:hypothetical protein
MRIIDQKNLVSERILFSVCRISICGEYGRVIIKPLHSEFVTAQMPFSEVILVNIEYTTHNGSYGCQPQGLRFTLRFNQ